MRDTEIDKLRAEDIRIELEEKNITDEINMYQGTWRQQNDSMTASIVYGYKYR
jgi:hypothetical protein